MKAFTIKLNDKEINFKLSSSETIALEKELGKPAQSILTEISFTNATSILKHCRKFEDSTFTHQDACALFDELVDNDYSLQTIYTDIIYPVACDCGLLTKGDLMKIRQAVSEMN